MVRVISIYDIDYIRISIIIAWVPYNPTICTLDHLDKNPPFPQRLTVHHFQLQGSGRQVVWVGSHVINPKNQGWWYGSLGTENTSFNLELFPEAEHHGFALHWLQKRAKMHQPSVEAQPNVVAAGGRLTPDTECKLIAIEMENIYTYALQRESSYLWLVSFYRYRDAIEFGLLKACISTIYINICM